MKKQVNSKKDWVKLSRTLLITSGIMIILAGIFLIYIGDNEQLAGKVIDEGSNTITISIADTFIGIVDLAFIFLVSGIVLGLLSITFWTIPKKDLKEVIKELKKN